MYIRSNGSSHHTRNPIRKDILYIARSGKMEVLRSAVMLPWCSISPTAKIVFTLTDVSGENGPRSHQVLALSTTLTMKSWQFRWGQPTALVHYYTSFTCLTCSGCVGLVGIRQHSNTAHVGASCAQRSREHGDPQLETQYTGPAVGTEIYGSFRKWGPK